MVRSRTLGRFAATATAVAVAVGLAATPAAHAAEVTLADPVLAACVRDNLGIGAADPIEDTALAAMTALWCPGGIVSLDGIEGATALRVLSFTSAAEVADVTPIAALPQLTFLAAPGLSNIDLEPLTTAPSLSAVNLTGAGLTSLTDVAGIPNLTELEIDNTLVTSLAPLANVGALRRLTASGTAVASVAPLQNLGFLRTLDLRNADLASITPLSGHGGLERLYVDGNHLLDASAVGTMSLLETFTGANQSVDGGTVARCTPFTTPSAVDPSGAALPVTGAGAYAFGPQTLFRPSGGSTLQFDDGAGFSGSVSYSATGSPTACAWPASFSSTVTVDGVAKQGETLTASATLTGAPTGAAPTSALAWETTGGTPIGTGSTLALDSGLVGSSVVATATVTLAGMDPYVAASAPRGPVVGLVAGELATEFTGPAVAGTSPGVAVSGLDDAGGAYSFRYEWSVDGNPVATTDFGEPIAYVIPASATGKSLAVVTTVRRAGYEDRTLAAASTTVLGAFGAPTQTFAVTGKAVVPSTLTATPPTYGITPSTVTYQWLRNGAPIANATRATYAVTTADAGKQLSVAITSALAGYQDAVWVSSGVAIAPLFAVAPVPTVSGKHVIGTALTASAGAWSPTPATLTYQWYRADKAISGATARTYTLTRSDVGKTVRVRVTAAKPGYSTQSRLSEAKVVLDRLTTATPRILDTAKVGATVRASTGVWGPGTVGRSLSWYVNGVKVGTGWEYKVKPTDAFKKLRLRVDGSKTGFASATRWSAEVTVQGRAYSTCTALRSHYPDGVARSTTTKNRVNGVVVSGLDAKTFVSQPLWELNRKLDRDLDGWACE